MKTVEEKDKSGRKFKKKIAFFSQSPKEAMLLRGYEKSYIMELYGAPWRAKGEVDKRYDIIASSLSYYNTRADEDRIFKPPSLSSSLYPKDPYKTCGAELS
jgi:hypothetical protein